MDVDRRQQDRRRAAQRLLLRDAGAGAGAAASTSGVAAGCEAAILDNIRAGCYRCTGTTEASDVLDPQQKQAADTFDSYRDNYSMAVDEAVRFSGLHADFFTRVKAAYLLDEARAHFGDPAEVRALDVGCGVGNFHPLLSPHLKDLHGIDISEACIDAARERHPDVAYRSYDGSRLPYDDASFDLAFAICVLHHVPTASWDTFARELHRVVRPGGLALIFKHNPLNPLTMRVVNRCPFDADAVLLKSGETQRLLAAAGFGELRTRFILSIPAGTRWLRRIDRLASRLPLGAQYFLAGTRT